jgi:hypothetical protein
MPRILLYRLVDERPGRVFRSIVDEQHEAVVLDFPVRNERAQQTAQLRDGHGQHGLLVVARHHQHQFWRLPQSGS